MKINLTNNQSFSGVIKYTLSPLEPEKWPKKWKTSDGICRLGHAVSHISCEVEAHNGRVQKDVFLATMKLLGLKKTEKIAFEKVDETDYIFTRADVKKVDEINSAYKEIKDKYEQILGVKPDEKSSGNDASSLSEQFSAIYEKHIKQAIEDAKTKKNALLRKIVTEDWMKKDANQYIDLKIDADGAMRGVEYYENKDGEKINSKIKIFAKNIKK